MEWQPEEVCQGTLLDPETRAKEVGIELLPEKEAYADMSKKLLGGWTMLNEHCPISGFPLLRKDDVTWSVRCNMVRPSLAFRGAPLDALRSLQEVKSADDTKKPTKQIKMPAPAPVRHRPRAPTRSSANPTLALGRHPRQQSAARPQSHPQRP